METLLYCFHILQGPLPDALLVIKVSGGRLNIFFNPIIRDEPDTRNHYIHRKTKPWINKRKAYAKAINK